MKIRYQLLVFLYGAFVFWLLTKPKIFEGTTPVPYVDTVGHFLLFAVMAWLIYGGIYWSDPLTAAPILWAAAFFGAAVYGAFLEVVQVSVPLRTFEWGDVGANNAGALVGTLLSHRWMAMPEKKKSRLADNE